MTSEIVQINGQGEANTENFTEEGMITESPIIQTNEYGSVKATPIPEGEPLIVQTDEYGVIKAATMPVDANSMAGSSSENTEMLESWQALQAKVTKFVNDVKSFASRFFDQNRQLLVTLGWFFLVILGARLLFAGLDAIDDIPLITPILKLIGLVYIVRFVWRYLLRQKTRQELMATISQAKSEMFGTQSEANQDH